MAAYRIRFMKRLNARRDVAEPCVWESASVLLATPFWAVAYMSVVERSLSWERPRMSVVMAAISEARMT